MTQGPPDRRNPRYLEKNEEEGGGFRHYLYPPVPRKGVEEAHLGQGYESVL